MQQLMIDISTETPEGLELAAEFLRSHAALKRAIESATPSVPTGTQPAPLVPAAPVAPAAASLTPSTPNAPTAPTAPGNVVPFVPPAPTNAPPAAIPGTSSADSANPSNPATASPGASAAPPVDEYDSAGVPWDARIHQKGKGQKKDKTWKLQKGIADSLVSTVMQELAPRIRKAPAAPAAPAEPNPAAVFGHTPLPAGASAPVSLPPVPPVPTAPQVPPVTGGPQGVGSPEAPPAPPGAETVAPPADPFRAIVAKITKARGEKRLTAEEVTQCCASAGVPTLQSLNAMPHLIATVEANIDALLATR